MANSEETGNERDITRITVEASDVDGVVDALGFDIVENEPEEAGEAYAERLGPVISTLDEIYDGVWTATGEDSRGRSRKMVRQYAGREDLDSEAIGYHLRVLEEHGLVVQDGNRWRIPEDDREED